MPHKLLLADDSVTIQRVIELTFADEDVQVIAVGDGKQAIERAEREHPDIVLADVGMPERDGYEVAAFVKRHPALSHVPVILLTGAFEPIDEGRARAVGCDGVLVKPFEPQMVISRVRDLLAGKRPAGLWGSGPTAQGPVRAAVAPERTAIPTASAGRVADPLEAYFDRLDAAFAAASEAAPAEAPPAPEPPPAAPAHVAAEHVEPHAAEPLGDLAAWDPDLEGDPSRPAVEPPPAPIQQEARLQQPVEPPVAPQPVRPAAPSPQPAAYTSGAVQLPSLLDAFTALLAAEQGAPFAPGAAAARAPAIWDDELVERITERVLARLKDDTLRPAVLDAAERLVREEIERIKRAAG